MRSLSRRIPDVSKPWAYAVAVASVVLAGLLQRQLLPFPTVAPFLSFYLAVTLASWLGGRGPGLLAGVLGAFAGNYFFTTPLHELTLSGPLGRATWLFLATSAVVALLGGSLRDTTTRVRGALDAQRRATQDLSTSEERLRLAKAASGLGIYDHDLRTGAIDWDERLREIFGASPGVAVDWDSFVSRINPEDRPAFSTAVERADASNSAYMVEYRFARVSDGVERWVRATGHVQVENSKVVRHVGTVEDVTERRQAAESLRAANIQLAEADRSKNEFLGVLSHELRNPLTPIRNSLYVLQRATPGSEQARRAQAVIERQVGQLSGLVDDLLDVTRISRGKIRLQRTRIELVDLIRRTAEDHRVSLQESHRFVVQLPHDAVWMDGDPTRIAQVLGNLLANAGKFTPAGGTISVSLRATGGRAVMEVSDTGVGMDSETLKHLFQPFAQADRSLDRSHGGLGLGLALVKGIVELHGGEVVGQSDGPGKGSRFTVTLPIEERAAVAPGPQGEGQTRGPRRSILIIEDNKDSADSLFEVLSLDGHHVFVAYDGEEGVTKAGALGPEIVLCDIGLPAGMDGYDVARALRRDPRTSSAFLVALSGYAQPEDLQRAIAAGFDAHLAKPPDLAELERLLGAASARSTRPVEASPP